MKYKRCIVALFEISGVSYRNCSTELEQKDGEGPPDGILRTSSSPRIVVFFIFARLRLLIGNPQGTAVYVTDIGVICFSLTLRSH